MAEAREREVKSRVIGHNSRGRIRSDLTAKKPASWK